MLPELLDTRSAEPTALAAELSSATNVMSLADTTRLMHDEGLTQESGKPETAGALRMAG